MAALLAELESAAEARDATRFSERLSPAFHAADGAPKEEIVAELRRYFAAYETVSIDVYGVETQRNGGDARVRLIVELSGQARRLPGLAGLLPPSAVNRFELSVADEDGIWRVRDARWEAVEPGAEAGQ